MSNFVRENEQTTGYFQGMNFVAHYIYCVMQDTKNSVSLFNYIAEQIFSVVCADQNYFNFVKYRSGEGMMILIYICERLIKINNPKVYDHMSCQQFSTNPLITLFTWHYKSSFREGLPMLHIIWDLIVLVAAAERGTELEHGLFDLPVHHRCARRLHP